MRPVLAATLLFTLVASVAAARPPAIEVRDAWIRATPPGAMTAAGYLTITNHGITTDRLIGADSRAARSVMPHHMSMAGGVMTMRPITGGLAIAVGATARLAPNGDHLMFTGLKGPLVAGQHVKVTLNFERAGQVVADFPVRADAPAGGMGGMHM